MGRYTNTIIQIAKNYCEKYPKRGMHFNFDDTPYFFGNKKQQPKIFFKNSENTWKKILTRGSLALGETYVDKLWDGSHTDVPYFLEFMLNIHEDKDLRKNINFINKIIIGFALMGSTNKSIGLSHKHNINSHYSLELVLNNIDASNDFFSLFLTKEFPVYSCGVWDTGAQNLQEAQLAKFMWYADLLKLDNTKKLIDLGCGWGAQSLWYAKKIGVNVTLITLSKAQAKYIENKIKFEGLQDKAKVRLMDMMDIDSLGGKYDAIISLGAIEHIEDFDTLFKKSSKILSKKGKALFHTMFNHIHHDFDAWNGKYMWPGIQIPSRKRLLDPLSKYFKTVSFTQYRKGSYSKTFRHWLQNFIDNENELLSILDKAESAGNNEQFMRQFKYYLQCCSIVYNVYMDVGFALCDNNKIKRDE